MTSQRPPKSRRIDPESNQYSNGIVLSSATTAAQDPTIHHGNSTNAHFTSHISKFIQVLIAFVEKTDNRAFHEEAILQSALQSLNDGSMTVEQVIPYLNVFLDGLFSPSGSSFFDTIRRNSRNTLVPSEPAGSVSESETSSQASTCCTHSRTSCCSKTSGSIRRPPSYTPRLVYDYLSQNGHQPSADVFAEECHHLVELKHLAEATGERTLPVVPGPSLLDMLRPYLIDSEQEESDVEQDDEYLSDDESEASNNLYASD